jgi:lysophospholipase L1-like esterase
MLLLASVALGSFYLHPHDRVCFYGDSITEQRLYTLFVEDFVRTRYPKLDVSFINRGWGGDTVFGGGGGNAEERMTKDVAPLKATVVTLMLGMNDGHYYPVQEESHKAFSDGYTKLVDLLKKAAPGARLTFIRTSPWDDVAHDFPAFDAKNWHPWHGYNDVLINYGNVPIDLAKANNALYVDFNQPLLDALGKARERDANAARQIIPDAIHPGPAGHLLMAAELLKGWDADPVVSNVTIDAAATKVTSAEKAHVTNLTKAGAGLTWTEHEEDLPFAYDPDNNLVKLALASSDFTTSLNREMLMVSGLAEGAYALSIDNAKVGTFSASQLAVGVNLALLPTPMQKQSLKVFDLCRRRSDTEFGAWRAVERPNGELKSMPGAARAVRSMAEEIDRAAREAAMITPHEFKLEPVSK